MSIAEKNKYLDSIASSTYIFRSILMKVIDLCWKYLYEGDFGMQSDLTVFYNQGKILTVKLWEYKYKQSQF